MNIIYTFNFLIKLMWFVSHKVRMWSSSSSNFYLLTEYFYRYESVSLTICHPLFGMTVGYYYHCSDGHSVYSFDYARFLNYKNQPTYILKCTLLSIFNFIFWSSISNWSILYDLTFPKRMKMYIIIYLRFYTLGS